MTRVVEAPTASSFPKKRKNGENVSSNELWEGRSLDEHHSNLFVYGSLCYASVKDSMPYGERCVYLGTAITEGVKACKVLVIKRNKIYNSRNVKVDECSFPFRQANQLPKIMLSEFQSDEVERKKNNDVNDEQEFVIHRILPSENTVCHLSCIRLSSAVAASVYLIF